MRQDGKIARSMYTGNGVKSIEWIDPPAKKKGVVKTEPKTEKKDR